MTITGSGSFAIDAVAGVPNAPSISRAGRFSVNFAGVTSLTNFAIVIGETTTHVAPSTLAGLANSTTYNLPDFTTGSFSKTGATKGGHVTITGTESGDASWTPGHYAWICLFPSATPSSGDAPAVSIDGGVIVA